ncbi:MULTISPECIES: patatin-like phospholipase family protein [Hyphobacterium]|uniref:Patatin-like phospholipase family protein n=1 Tax=Hyphobacterium vulgare TaxID=1736751 RepID=A0ABV6ZX23_9PROT
MVSEIDTASTERDEAEESRSDVAKALSGTLQSSKFEPNSMALACSGGGYKSGAYQLGAFIRMNELGMLPKLGRITSVSGGSITAAFLGLKWRELVWKDSVAANFADVVTAPLTHFFTTVTLDEPNILRGLVPGMNAGEGLIAGYRKHLFGDATLQDFPDDETAPRFTILATDFELNTLWRFSRPYAANYRVGRIDRPDFPLAQMVAASSGFPPFFCPIKLDLKLQVMIRQGGEDAHHAPYTERSLLADAGIYDNLGLEPIWKRYGVLLVSNAGDPASADTEPQWWGKTARRALSLVHRQAENNRVRWLVSLAVAGERKLAYIPLRGDVSDFPAGGGFSLSKVDAESARQEAVRLKAMRAPNFERLVRHGYSMSNAAIAMYLPQPQAIAPHWPILPL